ncbi:MAG: alpha/beta hydrolase, partial [Gemmatimonadales bacterium]
MNTIAVRIAISIGLWGLAVLGLVVLGTADAPPPAPNITQPFAAIDYSTLPPLSYYRARDGARLSYRKYPASGQHVAVLIHGSAGSSGDMHPLAAALQRAGVTTYALDVRGHGANSPHGDIAYVGQLDDDMVDFMAGEKSRYPDAVWTLIGFSSGGGFALRVAAEKPLGAAFDRYLLISPYLKHNAPSTRQDDAAKDAPGPSAKVKMQHWAAVSTGRIIGLSILNRFGLHH